MHRVGPRKVVAVAAAVAAVTLRHLYAGPQLIS
jgi:hypothetical protein